MLLSTIIVDDEPLARKGLAIRLKAHSEVNLIGQCANGKEALEIIDNEQVDLMFLDIQMPGLTGFQVLENIIEQQLPMPAVVFVTAFDQYALKAFEVHALDYLLKPADEQRLAKTMAKIKVHFKSNFEAQQKSKLVRLVSDVTGKDYQQLLTQLANNQELVISNYSDVIAIKDAGEVHRVQVKDILWIDAAGDYMCVHTADDQFEPDKENTYILRKTMKELEGLLDPRQFIRNHRSTIVNKNIITKFSHQVNGEHYLFLKNGKALKVSRSYKDKVKLAIHN
jgi:two-component system LytT family response regulator